MTEDNLQIILEDISTERQTWKDSDGTDRSTPLNIDTNKFRSIPRYFKLINKVALRRKVDLINWIERYNRSLAVSVYNFSRDRLILKTLPELEELRTNINRLVNFEEIHVKACEELGILNLYFNGELVHVEAINKGKA